MAFTDARILIERLVDQTYELFPEELHWPLVSAAILPAEGDAFSLVTTNVITPLLPGPGYTPFHAEELLLAQYSGETQEVEIVVTMEPCNKKRTGDKLACARRIVEHLAESPLKVARLVIGAYQNGYGIARMARAGLNVVLLHGPEHAKFIPENIEGRVAGINREAREAGGHVQLAESPLDRLNRVGFLRERRHRAEEDERELQVVDWFEARAHMADDEIVDALLAEHALLFPLGERPTLLRFVASELREPDGAIDRVACSGLIEPKVNRVFRDERMRHVEAELRGTP